MKRLMLFMTKEVQREQEKEQARIYKVTVPERGLGSRASTEILCGVTTMKYESWRKAGDGSS